MSAQLCTRADHPERRHWHYGPAGRYWCTDYNSPLLWQNGEDSRPRVREARRRGVGMTAADKGMTSLFPSLDDEPSYFIKGNDLLASGYTVALDFDSGSRHQLFPPSADYLRRLAVKATALADRWDELAAKDVATCPAVQADAKDGAA